ncbi:MAG: hypothetical protein M3Z66_10820 [Chloroflexota bacterium]|nr:hypothetical protein [Chloroflexota bacterium]
MFTVDEATADAIRRAYEESGELGAVVEFRRHFPLITDGDRARDCVRVIVSWQPLPEPRPSTLERKAQRAHPERPRQH